MKQSEQLQQTILDHAFRSIGLPDAELKLIKSELHTAIKAAITKQGWNQKQAGEKLGWGQPDVSKIMNDRFSQHSVERLIKAALDLGLTVSFGVAAPRAKSHSGRVALVARIAAKPKSVISRTRRPAAKKGKARLALSPAQHAAAE